MADLYPGAVEAQLIVDATRQWWAAVRGLEDHHLKVTRLSDDQRIKLAVAALDCSANLRADLTAWDPPLAWEALRIGASAEQVAIALGLEPGELTEWLTAWADAQLQTQGIDQRQYREIQHLVGDPRRDGWWSI